MQLSTLDSVAIALQESSAEKHQSWGEIEGFGICSSNNSNMFFKWKFHFHHRMARRKGFTDLRLAIKLIYDIVMSFAVVFQN